MIAKLIRKTLWKVGIDIKKAENTGFNLELYKKRYPKESLDLKRFYNVGAGLFYHPYWTNVDYISDWYEHSAKETKKGINYDLFSLTPIPVEDGVGEIVYSSHTIEHIKDEHALYFFNEAFRILKKGGIIRLTAPDIDLHYKAYRKNDLDFYYWKEKYVKKKDYSRAKLNQPLNTASIGQLFLQKLATSASMLHVDGIKERINDEELKRIFEELPYEEALDYCCSKCPVEIQKKYPGNHVNWWNREKAMNMLKKAGFQDINISGHGQSQAPVLRNTRLFDSTHPKISLYVEAVK
ncbi:MAG: methyltransferase domain-containing protein [Bacteroidales bacterium]